MMDLGSPLQPTDRRLLPVVGNNAQAPPPTAACNTAVISAGRTALLQAMLKSPPFLMFPLLLLLLSPLVGGTSFRGRVSGVHEACHCTVHS